MDKIKNRKLLIVEDHSVNNSPVMKKAIDQLCIHLEKSNYVITRTESYAEALPLSSTDMDIDAILMAQKVNDSVNINSQLRELLKSLRLWQNSVPLFLFADRETVAENISKELLEQTTEFIWILEDSPEFIAGRISAAVERFRNKLLPPLMRAIWEYNDQNHEYSYAAPGHQGGTGFTKTQSGKKFYDFYGENLFRTDTGIERSSIGSLLDHTGAFGESEKLAAKVFGSDLSFSGIAGTSGSNRSIMQSVLSEGDLAICDRNCHKSIEQGLINTGAIPIYMVPTRNRYGIIGPVPKVQMSEKSIQQQIKFSPLKITGNRRTYAVLTNCTYDGLCYNASIVEKLLEKSAEVIHFDEAWYAYAKFNPIYKNHFAMREKVDSPQKSTIFATHSTHKLLAALSQSSFIHMRNGEKKISFEQLNQGYMLNSSTSPLYAICASNDIAVKMMSDNGTALTGMVISEAVDFRKALAKLERDFAGENSWFFKVWNPPTVHCPKSGKDIDFADAPHSLLCKDQRCWQLRPGESWHGFEQIDDQDFVMLDPIKVSILTPGMNDDGQIADTGVPAALVSGFLYNSGIVPTRTTDFQLMFLFSIGITRGKWVTLLDTLLRFKKLYDKNAPLVDVLPEIYAAHPDKYKNCGIRDVGEKMFDHLKHFNPGAKLNAAFETLPEIAMSPRQAYMTSVRGKVELVHPEKLSGRIAANAVIPYPPGIPMVMSGEKFGNSDNPHIAYLQSLSAWDRKFPGFEHVTEGTKVIDGEYFVPCLTE